MTAETVPEAIKDVIMSNDFIAVYASLRYRPSSESALEKMTMPCLIYVGDQDPRMEPSERAAAQLPNSKLVILPGLDHVGAYMTKDAVMPHVSEFLETLN